ncbi:restriction endonuclease [Micromonospora noduli]|uniref:restriction endonuclease n=1 Tax=Micromonospora noduli TaxID=709876 RepID=UPI003422816E
MAGDLERRRGSTAILPPMTSIQTGPTVRSGQPGPNQIRTWQDAEHNAAEWMRYWGYADAAARPGGSDGGIDVQASGAVAQVKYHASAVGRPALQLLYGARGGASHKQLIFFTGSGYTTTAVTYADENDMALFVYSLDGSMRAMNAIAERISAANVTVQPSGMKLTKASAPATPTPPGTWRRVIGVGLIIVPLLPVVTGRNPFQGPVAETIMKITTLLAGIYLFAWGRGAGKAGRPSREPAPEEGNVGSTLPTQVVKARAQPAAPGILRFLTGWLLLCGTIVPPDDGVFAGRTTQDVVKILWIVLSCALMLWGILAKTTPRSRIGRSTPQSQASRTSDADDALRAEARTAPVLADPPVSVGPTLARLASPEPTLTAAVPTELFATTPAVSVLPADEPGEAEQTSEDIVAAPAVLDQGDSCGPDPLREDARAAWAYRTYLQARGSQPLHPAAGAKLLAAVDPDDHVEIIIEAAVQFGARLLDLPELTRNGTAPFVAARTMRRWIIVERATGAVTVCTGPSFPGMMAGTTRATTWPNVGWSLAITADDGQQVGLKVFSDDERLDRLEQLIKDGAAAQIMLLPEQAEVPALPDLDATASAGEATATPPSLPTDWRTSEEIAAAHMRALGFADAELTGGGRDGGLDVVAGTGVAQVKMQAQPVGAPLVQQLRGTRPQSAHHLFYSTSGYTAAARGAAAEIGVHLFVIGRDGTVSPVDDAATELAEEGVSDPEAVRQITTRRTVQDYVQGVADRIMAAVNANEPSAPGRTGRYSGHGERALRYLHHALENLNNRPESFASLRSAAVYYHHTELLAHVWFREMGVPYPGGERPHHEPDTLDAFYS